MQALYRGIECTSVSKYTRGRNMVGCEYVTVTQGAEFA